MVNLKLSVFMSELEGDVYFKQGWLKNCYEFEWFFETLREPLLLFTVNMINQKEKKFTILIYRNSSCLTLLRLFLYSGRK